MSAEAWILGVFIPLYGLTWAYASWKNGKSLERTYEHIYRVDFEQNLKEINRKHGLSNEPNNN